jgi:hypothetical protein
VLPFCHNNADDRSSQLTLFASVETGALAIPGIETSHWLTRAFWLGGTMIAVCGILTGAMLPGACHVFFGENESLECKGDPNLRLTLDTNAALFHQIDALFSLPTLVSFFFFHHLSCMTFCSER